jgi:hypothetical protein
MEKGGKKMNKVKEIAKKPRLTSETWRNFDPWECCGQDSFCKRGCHEKGGCANGCIVPRLYCRLAEYEDAMGLKEEVEK